MRKFSIGLVEILRATCLIALFGTQAHSADLCPLVQDLNLFVASSTGYVPPPCPQIGFTAVPPAQSLRSQAGAYLPDSGRIELAPDLDLTTIYGQSYLLHELVHAAQYANNAQTRAACPAALEAEAYSVQADFLRQNGLPQEAVLISLLANQLGSCGQISDD